MALAPLIEEHGTRYFTAYRKDLIWEEVKNLAGSQLERAVKKFMSANKRPSVDDFKAVVRGHQTNQEARCEVCGGWGWSRYTSKDKTQYADSLCVSGCKESKLLKIRAKLDWLRKITHEEAQCWDKVPTAVLHRSLNKNKNMG